VVISPVRLPDAAARRGCPTRLLDAAALPLPKAMASDVGHSSKQPGAAAIA